MLHLQLHDAKTSVNWCSTVSSERKAQVCPDAMDHCCKGCPTQSVRSRFLHRVTSTRGACCPTHVPRRGSTWPRCDPCGTCATWACTTPRGMRVPPVQGHGLVQRNIDVGCQTRRRKWQLQTALENINTDLGFILAEKTSVRMKHPLHPSPQPHGRDSIKAGGQYNRGPVPCSLRDMLSLIEIIAGGGA